MTSIANIVIAKRIALTLLLGASLWLAPFAVASAEVITSFDVDYEVHGDSSVMVTETIVYNFDGASRYGIYRKVENTHPQPATAWYKDRYVDINLLSVTRDGRSEPYKLESYRGLSIRIGDANRTITGEHTYQIVYKLKGAIADYPREGTEFNWNVTGDEWEVLIKNVSVRVRTTADAQLRSAQACYSGLSQSVSSCTFKDMKQNTAIFKQSILSPGQELTIAQALTLPNPPIVLEQTKSLWLWLIGVLVWFGGLGTWLYRWRFEYKPNQTIIPQYEPYKDFKPMFTGVLVDNKLDSRDISAGIVYLAQQGFISIKQTTDKVLFLFNATDYEVTLNRNISEIESSFLKSVLTLLFGGYTEVLGKTIKLSEVKKNSTQRILNTKIMKDLRKAVIKDLVDRGFLEQRMRRATRGILLGVLVIIGVYVLPAFLADLQLDGIIFMYLVGITVLTVLLFALERRTQQGFEALNHLKGFKDFLSVTEKERYKFHNAPALSPQQFMDYLPYAIAFGVEKEWAKVFKDIQIENPGWYTSSTGASFNAASFTTGLGAFSTAFSSSTGSSGSSGGGSAGGGGGGGGGGSW